MKKNRRPIDMYVMVTQSIFSIFVLIGLGYGLGYLINKHSVLPGILATFFGIAGVIGFIVMLYKMNGDSNG